MDRALSSLTKLRQKSSKDLTCALSKEYPSDPSCYELLEDCGRGVSATVHRAVVRASGEVVAVKKMNLERVNMGLEEIIHEAQTMKSYHHPNVLPLYTSFVHGQDLWMVTPFMSGGSVLHIMKYKYPGGLDEVAIATIMKFVLLGLEYVHKNNGIHRDVKAGNILIDRDGTVRIGDFGVAATPKAAQRDGDWRADNTMRSTFVGTPCWMAPEVMEQSNYNNKADIWSFGITLLELANGHAPFAKFPPMKVLLMTLQGPAPQLDDQPGRRHFSKHFRNVIARCLNKLPGLRPSASELLNDKFFKQARDEEFLVRLLTAELPALGERVQLIRDGKAATNAAENDRQLERSQEEYKKGVSSWNFDVAALKAQAALQPDEHGGAASSSIGGSAGGPISSGASSSGVAQAPTMPSISEAPEFGEEAAAVAAGVAVGGGSGAAAAAANGSSSRRSTSDDAAGLPSAAAATAPAAAVAAAAGIAAGTAAAAGARSDGGGGAGAGAEQQAAAEASLPAAEATSKPPGTQPPPLPNSNGNANNMRRAASAFAGSHELAAAAAAGGSSSGGGSGGIALQGHFSEPSQGAAAANASSSSAPPPAPSAGLAHAVQLSSGSLHGLGASASSGGSSLCFSPSNGSPPMSRESSSHGPLSALAGAAGGAAAMTPEGGAAPLLKGKSKGRFQVYEHGDLVPPMSPPASSRGSLSEALQSGSFNARSTPPPGAAAAPAAAAEPAGAASGGGVAAAALPPVVAGSVGTRVSDQGGGEPRASTDTPRAGRPVLGPAEAAELKAAAAAATAAAGTTGPPPAAAAPPAAPAAAAAAAPTAATGGAATGDVSTCSTPPPGSTAAAAAAAAAAVAAASVGGVAASQSIDGSDAPAASAEPKTRGRFKIIEEDGPSRGSGSVSKVPSSANLQAVMLTGSGRPAGGRALGANAAALLPELTRLHEQAAGHAAALARLIDGMRASASGGNLLAASDDSAGAAAAGGGQTPTAAAAAAAAAAAGSGMPPPPRKPCAGGALSRGNSSSVLGSGKEQRGHVLHAMLTECHGDSMEVADRLLERSQDLERQVAALESELARVRPAAADGRARLPEASSSSSSFLTATGSFDAADSRAGSRRTSSANLAVAAAAATAATAAAGAAGAADGSSGGTPSAAALPPVAPAAPPVDRHSSSGTSGGGGGGDSGGGAPLLAR